MLDFSHLTDNPNVNIQSFFGDSDSSGQSATNILDWKIWTKPRGVNWIYMIGVGALFSSGNIFTEFPTMGIVYILFAGLGFVVLLVGVLGIRRPQ